MDYCTAGVPQYFNNIGSLKNNGFEIELNTTNINKKDFKWTTALQVFLSISIILVV